MGAHDQCPYKINLRPGDGIPNHDANPAPVETLTGVNISRFVYTFNYATPQFFRHTFRVPDNINPDGNVAFDFLWFPRVPPVVSEDIVLEVESVTIAPGENQDQALVSMGTVVSAADLGVDEVILATIVIPVSTLGWEANNLATVRISRDADNALDTLHTRADADDDALLLDMGIAVGEI